MQNFKSIKMKIFQIILRIINLPRTRQLLYYCIDTVMPVTGSFQQFPHFAEGDYS